MQSTMKGLVAKKWKDERPDLSPGHHHLNQEYLVRVSGSVEKKDDQFVSPTVSIPLVTTLALLWEKCGFTRDEAMTLLREAITEAMDEGVTEDAHIKERIEDVQSAVKAVRKDLISQLPKMKRSGRVITKDLDVELIPLSTVAPQPEVVGAA